jgi:glutamine phosphoribosylpyrophosphate amidotransferase
MCGIIAVHLDSPSPEQLEIVEKVMVNSKIRGLHASGVSYHDGCKIVCKKEPVSMEIFLKDVFKIEEAITPKEEIRMIAHTRYSTSDLNSNQPIGDPDGEISIVHNGVISQSPRSTWKQKFGFKGQSDNDSSLIIDSFVNFKSPLVSFPDSSMACAALDKNGSIVFFRNSKRPLWYVVFENGFIAASTKDILLRSGISEKGVVIALAGKSYLFKEGLKFKHFLQIPVDKQNTEKFGYLRSLND